MHPLNPYNVKGGIDLKALSSKDQALKELCDSTGRIDWGHSRAQYEVARVLLKSTFDVSWSFPENMIEKNLSPAVPRSVNYLLFMQDLLSLEDSTSGFLGVDVGTGASCIFSLIGCRIASDWNFVGLDVDLDALQNANDLIKRNGLEDRVQVLKSEPGMFLVPAKNAILKAADEGRRVFVVCNPPFFDSFEEEPARKRAKRFEFHGTENEKSYTGEGDLGFFKGMFEEIAKDMELSEIVGWFSCMFGHKASAICAVEFMKDHPLRSPTAVTSAWLVQGKKHRWVVAWSHRIHPLLVSSIFASDRKPSEALNFLSTEEILKTPPASLYPTQTLTWNISVEEMKSRIKESFQTLHQHQKCRAETLSLASGNRFRVRISREDRKDAFCLLCGVTVRKKEPGEGVECELSLLQPLAAQGGAQRGAHLLVLNRLWQKVRGDVMRTSRAWRRRLARGENSETCDGGV